jgi:2-oxoisovalerate dehydrogenase E1 component alpha subunit
MTIVANFSIEYTRFLDPQGEPTQALPAFAEDGKKLIQLYRTMTLTRMFDTKAITLQRTGKMGTYASILGQEATSVGVGDAMKKEDVLCPFYRDYGAQFMRGVKMSDILTYWGGDERGSCFENAREDFPICVPIGTQILHAAGVAAAFKIRKQPRVAVTSFGDGGTSEGDFYEAINVAGAWNLPVVFVIHNNRWAISVPLSMQTKAETLAQKAIAAGFKGEQVDGNDVIAVRYVMERALEKARTGGGPTLIEALTYRLGDHTTVDDATRYRSKEEVQQAWIEEPLARLRKYLSAHHGWTEKDEEKLIAECAAEVDKAVQEYLSLKPQPATAMFDYHYATLPGDLAEQRAYMLDNSSPIENH